LKMGATIVHHRGHQLDLWPRHRRFIWQGWFGPSPLPGYMQVLHDALVATQADSGARVRLVGDADLPKLLPEAHPALPLLSYVHRADYARAALLHKYGGIWLDTENLALRGFNHLWHSCKDDGHTIPRRGDIIEPVGPNTTFTRAWMMEVHSRLDKLLPQLHQHPGGPCFKTYCQPNRLDMSSNLPVAYPIQWEHILQDVWNVLPRKYPELNLHVATGDTCFTVCTYACALACFNAPTATMAQHTNGSLGGLGTGTGTTSWALASCARKLVAEGKNSHSPAALRQLTAAEFLRSSGVLAQMARAAMGLEPDEDVARAIRHRHHCLDEPKLHHRGITWACSPYANFTRWAELHPNDAFPSLTVPLRRARDDRTPHDTRVRATL